MRPAVFLDRDGTVIEHVPYLTDPADVRLVAGAGPALSSLRAAGFALVIVTNQSAMGRGMLDEAGLARVHAVLEAQLAEVGVSLDGIYWCPLAPQTSDPTMVEHADRKPGPGMLTRAAEELALDVSRSYMVGDNVSDALAGRNAGCRASVLVRTGHGAKTELDFGDLLATPSDHVVDDLAAAARLILSDAGPPG